MKKLFMASVFLVLMIAGNLHAATYYIAPASDGGNDSNNGTSSSTPWLTPNHSVNCGDVLIALPGVYAETSMRYNTWGTVTCPGNNNVAWVECQTPFACTMSAVANNNGVVITANYWGVQGFAVTTASSTNSSCFGSADGVHHIIFANDVAANCGGYGISAQDSDYVIIVGNAVYNGATYSGTCNSGLGILVPANSDSLAGTHIYIAGNFSWGNVDPNPCNGGTPTDGEGVNLDTISQNSYTGQIVVENNIFAYNGGPGVEAYLNNSSTPSPITIDRNTIYDNETGGTTNSCAEILLQASGNTNVFQNLIQQTVSSACNGPSATYLLWTGGGDFGSTVVLTNNFGDSASGHNFQNYPDNVVYGNTFGTSPAFSSPTEPSSPSCSSYTTVPACMASMISGFTPGTTSAKSYGYQSVSSASVYNPLFPQWLCSVTNLPSGLITMGCAAGGSQFAEKAPLDDSRGN